jgi:hypothetical protein
MWSHTADSVLQLGVAHIGFMVINALACLRHFLLLYRLSTTRANACGLRSLGALPAIQAYPVDLRGRLGITGRC